MPATPFVHVALNVDEETQAELERRIKDAGLEATYMLEHGYCRSVYVVDPNGMTVEFTCDDRAPPPVDAQRKAKDATTSSSAGSAGDHTPTTTSATKKRPEPPYRTRHPAKRGPGSRG